MTLDTEKRRLTNDNHISHLQREAKNASAQ